MYNEDKEPEIANMSHSLYLKVQVKQPLINKGDIRTFNTNNEEKTQ